MSRKIERELQRILALVEPKIARAFVAAMNDVATKADIKALIAAVRDNDVEAAIRAIGMDRSAFVGVYERLFEATALTGEAVAAGTIWQGVNGEKINVRFDMYNARAVDRLQNHTSRFVTNITNTAREVVRETISNGYSAGRGPIDIATDLVGRVTPRGRQGGSIGLSRTYEQWSSNMRGYLDSENIQAYKGMSLRDKRYDKMVERGNLTAAQKNKIIERYNDRLLKSRANAIARTETAEAVESSQAEAFAQYQDKSGVEDQFIIRQWDHEGSAKGARDWHLEMNGMQVRGLQQPFVTPRGAAMMHPLDTSLGAGAVEIVNCFLPHTKIHPIGINGAIRREYSGDIVNVTCGSDINLTVTANHPVLTERGWVRADEIVKGDNLLQCLVTDERISTEPNVTNAIPRADELYNAAESLGRTVRASRSVVDLHGEIPDHDVNVVSIPRELLNWSEASCLKAFGKFSLTETDVIAAGEVAFRRLLLGSDISSDSFSGFDSSSSIFLSLLRRHLVGASKVTLRNVWFFNAHIIKALVNKLSALANFLGNRIDTETIVKKPLNGVMKFNPSDLSSLDQMASKLTRIRCQPQVSDAVFSEGMGFPDTPSDIGSREPFGVERENLIEKEFPLLTMPFKGKVSIKSTAVDGVSVSHYSGPVYNFESDNGLLISDNIITHNCRCAQTITIDYKAMAQARDG